MELNFYLYHAYMLYVCNKYLSKLIELASFSENTFASYCMLYIHSN